MIHDEWKMNDEWWRMKNECWRMMISSCWGVLMTDKQTNRRTDICEYRVTFATENLKNVLKQDQRSICDSDKAAMVAYDHATSKCQTKVKYEWINVFI